MTWVKLDDGFTDHPKVVGLSDRAFRTHVRALCYCGRFSPGVGRIPQSALRQLGAAPSVVRELLGAILWEEDGEDGELYIHDFGEYHPKTDRKAKAEAGRLGGLASGQARRSKQEADVKQSASGLVEPNRTPVPDPYPGASKEAKKAAPSVPSKRVTDSYLKEIQPKHPTVDVNEVYEDARNRKVWGGYHDQHRALGKYIGWAEERVAEKTNRRTQNAPPVRQTFKAEGIFE